jgi:hypothetical protein
MHREPPDYEQVQIGELETTLHRFFFRDDWRLIIVVNSGGSHAHWETGGDGSLPVEVGYA